MVWFLRTFAKIAAAIGRRRGRVWQPGMPIECLVVGYGGANNTGAEARTAEAIRQILAADPRVRVTLTSLDRPRTLRYLEEHDRLRVAQIHPVFLVSVARLVARADIVVLAEGSCFKENFSPALLWFFLYAAELAQHMGIPTATYGVDAGVLTTRHARWAREVADRMDLLTVRTAAAAEVLRSLGVGREIAVTTDTAFTLDPADRDWAETVLAGQGIDLRRPLVGIAFEEFFWWPVVPSLWRALCCVRRDRYKSIYYHSWKGDARIRSGAMKEAVAAYAEWAASELGAQVVFFAMESLDIGPCRDVIARMRVPAVLIDADHASAAQMAALLRRLDWLVTCRYHALVLAMGAAVPTIGLAHDERIASILDELGFLHDYLIDWKEPRILPQLEEKTRRLRAASPEIRRRIEAAMPGYFSRNAENGRLFTRLLEQRFRSTS